MNNAGSHRAAAFALLASQGSVVGPGKRMQHEHGGNLRALPLFPVAICPSVSSAPEGHRW